jgi:diguanylate cyclase (GGDEF)-like protein
MLFSLWPEAYCVEGLVRHESEWRRELLQMAECDPLTGLPNRRTLQRALERNAARAGQFALLLLDLNGFKAVNDEYGHLRGDEVLKSVAQAMAGALRRDDMVIRYGGDEFALLIEGSKAEAVRVYERIGTAVAALGSEIDILLGFSAGVAVWPEDTGSLEELMQIADRRLYMEKQKGSRRRRSRAETASGAGWGAVGS